MGKVISILCDVFYKYLYMYICVKARKRFSGMICSRLRSCLLIGQRGSYHSKVAAIGRRATATGTCGRCAANSIGRQRFFPSSVFENLLVRMTPVKLLQFGSHVFTMVINSDVMWSALSVLIAWFSGIFCWRNLRCGIVNVSHLFFCFFFLSSVNKSLSSLSNSCCHVN